ncbi:MAG: hypothetical protein ACYDH8_06320 [Syntrophales bacterium]
MDRPSSLRTTSTGLLSPYKWGKHKWEDYLLDTQTVIYQGAREQVEATNRLAEQQASHQQALLDTFIQGALDANVAWDRISSQLDDLTDQVAFGFTTLSHQLNRQTALLQSVLKELDRIATALENPLAIQANELVRSGEHLLARQLYAEAYADLTAAVAKRSVNPILHLRLAQLHYHVRDTDVPFDYERADFHIQLSIRYATRLHADLRADGDYVVDLAYRTAAHISLVRSGDLATSGSNDASRCELAKASSLLQSIPNPSPTSRFLYAQVMALLGEHEEAIVCIRSLADFRRTWIARALAEPNLGSVADPIAALQGSLVTTPGPYSQRAFDSIACARSYAARLSEMPIELCTSTAQTILSAADSAAAEFEAGVIDASTVIATIRQRFRDSAPAIEACKQLLGWSAERYAAMPPAPALLSLHMPPFFRLALFVFFLSIFFIWLGISGMKNWAPGTYHVEGFFRYTVVSAEDMRSKSNMYAFQLFLGLFGLVYSVVCYCVSRVNNSRSFENSRRQQLHGKAIAEALTAAEIIKTERDRQIRLRLADLEGLADTVGVNEGEAHRLLATPSGLRRPTKSGEHEP